MFEVERNEYLEKIFASKKGKEYDAVVMYSGGKDSSFLLYLLKQVYHLNVVAAIVDNGFENNTLWEEVTHFTNLMQVPLEVIKPEKDNFKKLFHMLITEHELFEKKGTNHLCFICNNLLWANVAEYAASKEIPFVVSGLSKAQLSSGRPYPLEANAIANQVAEKSSKVILKKALIGMQQSKLFEEDDAFKNYIEDITQYTKQITTVYPYIYHNFATEDIKSGLTELGWAPPRNIDVKNYISSGCRIMSRVVKELEKLGIVTLNEREQARWMVEQKLADETDIRFAEYDATKEKVDLSDPLFEELEVKEYLTEYAKTRQSEQ